MCVMYAAPWFCVDCNATGEALGNARKPVHTITCEAKAKVKLQQLYRTMYCPPHCRPSTTTGSTAVPHPVIQVVVQPVLVMVLPAQGGVAQAVPRVYQRLAARGVPQEVHAWAVHAVHVGTSST